MLRRFMLLTTLAVSAALGCHAQTASTQYQHIKTAWTAPTGTFQTCSTTVTTGCIKSYVETLTDPTGKATQVQIPWGQTSYSWTPGGFLLCGTWNLSLLIDYLDGNGVDTTTAAVSAQVTVSCPFVVSPPSGFSGSAQP